MATIGLIDDLLDSGNVDRQNYLVRQSSSENVHYEHGLTNTLALYKKIGEERDIDTIIEAEEAFMQQESEFYGEGDKTIRSSFKSALIDMDSMKQSCKIAKHPDRYLEAQNLINRKEKYYDVPKDGFHKALSSHLARLRNRMVTLGLSIPEKNILRQRQENLLVAKELYISLQRNALGIPEPERDNGLER